MVALKFGADILHAHAGNFPHNKHCTACKSKKNSAAAALPTPFSQINSPYYYVYSYLSLEKPFNEKRSIAQRGVKNNC